MDRSPTINTLNKPKLIKLAHKILLVGFFLTALCLWVLGTLITLRIDAEMRARPFALCEVQVLNLTSRVDDFCARRARRQLLTTDVHRLTGTPADSDDVEEARMKRQERLVRNSLIYVKDLDQMWCLVPKAASTTWGNAILTILIEMGKIQHMRFSDGKTPVIGTTPPQVVLRNMYRKIKDEEYGSALISEKVRRILLVRHPFARLVSAYKDKLEHRRAKTDSMFFFRSYGVKIQRKFRPRKGVKTLKQKEPTFEEFIEYLISTDPTDYDEHWQPISLQCGLCRIRYDHIIRQEDLASMNEYHLHKLGFPSNFILPRDNAIIGNGQEKNWIDFYAKIPRRKVCARLRSL